MTDQTLAHARAGDEARVPRADRSLPARASAAHLPDRRLSAGRRGPPPGDACSPRGAASSSSRSARRSARGSTRSPPTARSMPSARCDAAPPARRRAGMPEPTRWNEPLSLRPYPDALLEGIPDEAPGPEARHEAKESIALAFIVGLQHLPPQQRAVLLLRDVLGYRTREVADMLESSEASVNSLLRRARSAFESRLPATGRDRAPVPDSKRRARDRRPFRRGRRERRRRRDGRAPDRRRVAHHAAPPPRLPGPRRDRRVPARRARSDAARRSRLRPTRANAQPAFAGYHSETDVARGLFVLTLEGNQISAITWFADTSVFPQFGLPPTLG